MKEGIGTANALFRLVNVVQPMYIFLGNDLTWENRILGRIASQLEIPTGTIQHGLIGSEPINQLHLVDQFFVYGEVARKTLISDGFSEKKIIVTGAPYLDSVRLNKPYVIDERIRQCYGVMGQYILVALSGPGHRTTVENHIKSIEYIIRLSIEHGHESFIYKLHRKDKPTYYLEIASKYGIKRINLVRGNEKLPKSIFSWLRGCKLVITGTSTVALEAMLLKIPVLSVDPLDEFYGIDFLDQQLVKKATTYSELVNFYKYSDCYYQTTETDIFINNNFFNQDGKASERIIHATETMIIV